MSSLSLSGRNEVQVRRCRSARKPSCLRTALSVLWVPIIGRVVEQWGGKPFSSITCQPTRVMGCNHLAVCDDCRGGVPYPALRPWPQSLRLRCALLPKRA